MFQPWPWPFAKTRRAEISAHFAGKQAEKPQLWNGRILLGRDPVFAGGSFRASYFEADFAGFLAWRDWGFPDRDVFNGFGMGALRCADGAFVLGEMGRHTANAGRIYFPSGTPDLDDISNGTVDLAGSVDPVHWSIRLLLPAGSLLLDVPEIQPFLGDHDAELLGTQWRSADPAMDLLQQHIAALVERGGDFADVRRLISGKATAPWTTGRPQLTETWFCCAEPTALQRSVVGGVDLLERRVEAAERA